MFFNTEFSIKDLDKYLTKSELLDLFHIFHKAHLSENSVNEEHLKRLILDLKSLVPFDSFVYGYITGNRDILYSIEIDYPQDYLERYYEKRYELIDPVATVFEESRLVVNWRDVDKIYDKQPEGIVNREAKEFGLLDGFMYGGFEGNYIGGFWFAGKHIERHKRSKAIIEFASQALAAPLMELYEKSKQPKRQGVLSKKEIEILNWLKEGKSSWDISVIMKISERTVNFHVNNIISKLDAVNRTHAVAIAITEGILGI